MSDIENASKHTNNENLRDYFFELYTFDDTLRRDINRSLRSEVREAVIDGELVNYPGEIEELLVSSINNIEVSVFGGSDGDDSIDMPRLRTQLEQSTMDLGGDVATTLYLSAADAIRSIYPSFTSKWSREMIGIYEKIEEASANSWSETQTTVRELRRKSDKEAVIWYDSNVEE